MTEKITIVLGQLNFQVGNILANLDKMREAIAVATTTLNADLIIFPELAITGYPPEDLLFHTGFKLQVAQALTVIAELSHHIGIIIGYPNYQADGIYNAAGLFYQGHCQFLYHKRVLPNYGVFDEQRYFKPGTIVTPFHFKGYCLGILICEDIWDNEGISALKMQGAELIITINASPFDYKKLHRRQTLLSAHAHTQQVAMLYVQTVGGQDDLIFDGGSMAVAANGQITHTAPFFAEQLFLLDYLPAQKTFFSSQRQATLLSPEAHIYQALVLGIKDYAHKNHFSQVGIGLSGGIDSALTFMLAVDALGADKVHAVMMPSIYTSTMSLEDAATLVHHVGAHYHELEINTLMTTLQNTLHPFFTNLPVDQTEENLQARCRGLLLMALSNKYQWLILTTGNKSELAVGYATLYGDMAGGYAVLKDVPKQWVYRLAHYRNQQSTVIPARILTRPPSAELAFHQLDSDKLPPYDILDAIIECYVEYDMDYASIIKAGYNPEVVAHILKQIDSNEYKRRQSPPGPKITTRAFTRERRYPITSGFRHLGIKIDS